MIKVQKKEAQISKEREWTSRILFFVPIKISKLIYFTISYDMKNKREREKEKNKTIAMRGRGINEQERIIKKENESGKKKIFLF